MSPIKTSEILKRAKKYLWDGVRRRRANDYSYICFAIGTVNLLGQGEKKRRAVCCEIENRLHPYTTICGWLHCQHNIVTLYKVRELQAYRHRWLDSLIKEYETTGD